MSHKQHSKIDTLIIVCCHAIYTGDQKGGAAQNEDNWLIEPFQSSETPTFIKHIEEGVKLLAQSHGSALLTFSGGATKAKKIRELKESGVLDSSVRDSTTEAESYGAVARESKFFGFNETTTTTTTSTSASASLQLIASIFQERFATDSYQNILLALLQYPVWLHQRTEASGENVRPSGPETTTGGGDGTLEFHLPRRLIIVSHEFKRARFMDLHVPAIMSLLTPLSDSTLSEVEFIGINPPFDEVKMKEIEEGDRLRGFGAWEEDLYGTGPLLSSKRIARGWQKDDFLQEVSRWYGERVKLQIDRILDGSRS